MLLNTHTQRDRLKQILFQNFGRDTADMDAQTEAQTWVKNINKDTFSRRICIFSSTVATNAASDTDTEWEDTCWHVFDC